MEVDSEDKFKRRKSLDLTNEPDLNIFHSEILEEKLENDEKNKKYLENFEIESLKSKNLENNEIKDEKDENKKKLNDNSDSNFYESEEEQKEEVIDAMNNSFEYGKN